jgi:autotransporter-associated beta strand protein
VQLAANVFTISGTISGTGGITLGPTSGTNAGTLVLSGSNSYAGGTIVQSGTLVIAANGALPNGNISINGGLLKLNAGTGLSQMTGLTIAGGGALDLGNNHALITYTGSSPISSIAGYIASGYNNGAWNGPGIESSVANSHYGIGYADGADGVVAGLASGQIEIAYTLYGDANLDGVVSGQDFAILVSNWGKHVSAWDRGDFNYDGVVSGIDFTELVGNLGRHASAADVSLPSADLAALDAFAAANGLMADVPEPGSLAVLSGMACLMLLRIRRSPSVR